MDFKIACDTISYAFRLEGYSLFKSINPHGGLYKLLGWGVWIWDFKMPMHGFCLGVVTSL